MAHMSVKGPAFWR